MNDPKLTNQRGELDGDSLNEMPEIDELQPLYLSNAAIT
jgi:hypothetical protein